MTTINVGPAATDRASAGGLGTTVFNVNYPSDGTGTITTVTVWVAATISSLKIGIMHLVSGWTYECTAVTTVSPSAGAGLKTFNGLSLAVESGDFIAFYFSTSGGQIDRDLTGGVCRTQTGDYLTVGLQTVFGTGGAPDRLYSIHGTGVTSVTPPTLTASAASDIAYTTVTLNGNITAVAAGNCTSRGFKYGKTSGALDLDWHEDGDFGTGAYSHGITSLDPGARYYFQAYAINPGGTGYSTPELYFDTLALAVPTLTVQAASPVSFLTATLNGNITASGGSDSTTRGFQYGKTSGALDLDTHSHGTYGTGAFSIDVASLDPGTTYYVRSYATNSEGTGYSVETSFVTLAKPTVTTQDASDLGATYATLNGNITSIGGGVVTSRGFQYGVSSDNLNCTSQESGSFGTGAYSLGVTGLTKGVMYYFRSFATNGGGTSYGETLSFRVLEQVTYYLYPVNDYDWTNDGILNGPPIGYPPTEAVYWNKIDDPYNAIDNSDYVKNPEPENWKAWSIRCGMTQIVNSQIESISSVVVHVRVKHTYSSPSIIWKFRAIINGTDYTQDIGTGTVNSFTDLSISLPLNPVTGLAWTISDINTMKMGVQYNSSVSFGYSYISSLYVAVTALLMPSDSKLVSGIRHVFRPGSYREELSFGITDFENENIIITFANMQGIIEKQISEKAVQEIIKEASKSQSETPQPPKLDIPPIDPYASIKVPKATVPEIIESLKADLTAGRTVHDLSTWKQPEMQKQSITVFRDIGNNLINTFTRLWKSIFGGG